MMPAVMPPSTMESLAAIVLEHLPESFATVEARAPLWTCARVLPLVLRGGFECRLDGASEQIDFHQLLKREDILRVRAFLSQQTAPPFDHPAWKRIETFLARWDDDLREQVFALFLEYDGITTDAAGIVPSPFVGFDPEHRADSSTTAFQALNILCDSLVSPSPAFQRCFEAQPPDWVSHLGVMLARSNAPFRLNVQMQSWDGLLPYLHRIDWPGDFDRLSRQITWLSASIESFTVALDVDSRIYPHIGLELFFPSGSRRSEGALRFLAALVDRRLCTPVKSAGLLEGNKWITPSNTKAAWADDLILRALHDPDHRLDAMILIPNHIKLTVYSDGKISTKGYLSFGPDWVSDENG